MISAKQKAARARFTKAAKKAKAMCKKKGEKRTYREIMSTLLKK